MKKRRQAEQKNESDSDEPEVVEDPKSPLPIFIRIDEAVCQHHEALQEAHCPFGAQRHEDSGWNPSGKQTEVRW